jgi:hypothetical protein
MSDETPDDVGQPYGPFTEPPDDNTPIMTPPVANQDEVKKKNRKEFWYGVGLFFVLNIIMGLCGWGVQFAAIAAVSSIGGNDPTLTNIVTVLSGLISFAPFVINVVLMIYFVVKNRPQVALGMLAGFAVLLLIAICLGVIFMAGCFVILSSYSG